MRVTTEPVNVQRPASADYSTLQKYSVLGTPIVSEGRIKSPLSKAPDLWTDVDVYGPGAGERVLHFHPGEDHSFFVLSGSATFHGIDIEDFAVGLYEGVMIPKGVAYGFDPNPGDPLVMLRIGSGEKIASENADGTPKTPKHERDGVPIPGRFLAAPTFG